MFFNLKFNRLPAFGAVFLLSIHGMWSSAHSDQIDNTRLAQSTVIGVLLDETREPACPAATNLSDTVTAPTLDLVWQSGGTPDEMIGQIEGIDAFPSGWLAVDFEGSVYVVIDTQGASVIKKFDTDGNFVMSFEVSVSGSTGIAVDSQGDIYINDFRNAKVLKFDSIGNFLIQWATEPPTGPTGIGVDPQGNLVVANHRTHQHYVQRFDSSGQLLAEWGSTGTGDGQFTAGSRSGPEGIAVGENGSIYVTDTNNNRILTFDHEGNFLGSMGTFGTQGHEQFDRPFGVSLDGEGNLYIVDQHFIQKFHQDGQFLTQWNIFEGELDSGGYYNAMAVDMHGNIYWLALGEIYVTAVEENQTRMVLKKFRQC